MIAIGAQRARDLDVPGRELAGVVLAMDYLDRAEPGRRAASARRAAHDVRGKRVVILGGGDTGSRLPRHRAPPGRGRGHPDRADAGAADRRATADNPWPPWPLVFRTSSSQEEGGERTFAFRTTHLEGDGGQLVALHGDRVERRPADRSICRAPSFVSTAICSILALGFTGPDGAAARRSARRRASIARGNIAVDRDYATNVPGVFCAGDAQRGASLVVWAIAEGRELARAVDRALK